MSITVRKPSFNFRGTSPAFWYDNNKFVSCFLSTLSATFPAGEKFFIRATRDNVDGKTPPKLKAEVKAFSEQEAQHSLKHIEFNEWLKENGYDVGTFEEVVKQGLKLAGNLPRKHRLAATCALEHVTALMADRLVTESDIFAEPIHEDFREFWKWHALEESEHKSVAFDVYKDNGYDEATRLVVAAVTTAILVVAIAAGQTYIASKKNGGGLKDTAYGLLVLFGPKGFLTRSVPKYLSYYKLGFHPEQN